MLLRRIAYNMLALYRAVTQRSLDKRETPWKDVMRWVDEHADRGNGQGPAGPSCQGW
ncbi:MAG: hypothetical protein K0B16_19015 [Burkholderiaceae bacterium]|nr:hypothetical protein [Burkholderiaceae bacterium]